MRIPTIWLAFRTICSMGEQARVLRLVPGLENAKFLRYGQIHRNTYLNAPSLLTEVLSLRQHSNVFFAGQISGVEGYTESIAMGMLAGLHVARVAYGQTACSATARDCAGLARSLSLPRRGEKLSAGQYYI